MGFKVCINPFKYHGGSVLFQTRSISAPFLVKCDRVLGQDILSEGQQLCDKCYSAIRHQYEVLTLNESITGNDELMECDVNLETNEVSGDGPKTSRNLRYESIDSFATMETTNTISIEDARFLFDSCLNSLQLPPMTIGLSNTQQKAEFVNKSLRIIDKIKNIMECLYISTIQQCYCHC